MPESISLKAAAAAFLTAAAVFTTSWSGMAYLKAGEAKDMTQDIRLEQAEKSATKTLEQIDRISEKVDATKEAVVKLTTVIEQNGLTKKAERQGIIETLPADFVIQTK